MKGITVSVQFNLLRSSLVVLVLAGIVVGEGSLYGQTVEVDCEEIECHVAPIASGSGGFVGRAAAGIDEVEAILTCRGTGSVKVVTKKLTPEADGLVSSLFGVDDGTAETLACGADDDATLEIRGLADGGWYWLHDDLNTAVAPLLSGDVLKNAKIMPVNPGSSDISVQANMANTASFVKQSSTGRVGIIPHVLPVPEEDVVACGPMADGQNADGSTKYAARETGCRMGDGGTVVALHTVAGPTRTPVTGNRVVRPAGDETVLSVSLWLNRTGSVVYGAAADFPLTFGWPGIMGSMPLDTVWAVDLPGSVNTNLATAGITLEDPQDSDDDGYTTLTVASTATAEYCPTTGAQFPLKVRVRAASTTNDDGTPLNPVRPPIRHSTDIGGAAAETTFDLVCPPRSAASGAGTAGRELTVGSGLEGR